MKLKIMNIPDEGLDLEAAVSKDRWFRSVITETYPEDFRKGNEALLELHLFKSCDNISISGSAQVSLTPACDRCLEGFDFLVDVPLHVDLAPAPETKGRRDKEAEVEAEDVNFAFYKGGEIDLGGILRETLLLEIPLRYVCSEACKGLCAHCGRNLNSGPCACAAVQGNSHFSVLKDLLK